MVERVVDENFNFPIKVTPIPKESEIEELINEKEANSLRSREEEKINMSIEMSKNYLGLKDTDKHYILIKIITCSLEMISSMSELITFLEKDINKKEDIEKLLIKVLKTQCCGENGRCNKGNNYENLLKSFVENYPSTPNEFLEENQYPSNPLEFILKVLEIFNNNNLLTYENLPHYYEADKLEISDHILSEKNKELRKIVEESRIRKFFGVAYTVPFTQVCKNTSCKKPYFVNFNCQLEFYFTYIYNEENSINSYLNDRFSKKKMKSTCVTCKVSNEDYRTRFETMMINVPKYLLINVKFENEDEEIIDGHDLTFSEINNLKILSYDYELSGVIQRESEKEFFSIRKVEGIYIDSEENIVQTSDEYIFKNAFILYYTLQ